MKNATRILDIIGTIWNTLVFLLAIVALIFGIVAKSNAAAIANDQQLVNVTEEAILHSAAILRKISLIFIAITIISIIAIIVAQIRLASESRMVIFHIIITLSGVFTLNLFYLLGGMFGVVIEDRKEDLD